MYDIILFNIDIVTDIVIKGLVCTDMLYILGPEREHLILIKITVRHTYSIHYTK